MSDSSVDVAYTVADRDSHGRFAKGNRGNIDRVNASRKRRRERIAAEAEILADIIARAGRPLTAVDMAFAKLAAAELARAQYSTDPNAGRAAARAASKMIAELRTGASFRPSRGAALDEHLARKAAQPA